MFSLKRLINSFRFAFRGFKIIFQEEQSFIIQLAAGLFVFFLMFYLEMTSLERAVLVIVISLILTLEIINTAVERILDVIEPNYDEKIGKIKDLISAAVLCVSLSSVVIAYLIVLPPLFRVLGKFW